MDDWQNSIHIYIYILHVFPSKSSYISIYFFRKRSSAMMFIMWLVQLVHTDIYKVSQGFNSNSKDCLTFAVFAHCACAVWPEPSLKWRALENLGWNAKQVLHNWFLRSGGERKTAAPAGTWLTEHHILQPAVSPDDPFPTQSDLRGITYSMRAIYHAFFVTQQVKIKSYRGILQNTLIANVFFYLICVTCLS